MILKSDDDSQSPVRNNEVFINNHESTINDGASREEPTILDLSKTNENSATMLVSVTNISSGRNLANDNMISEEQQVLDTEEDDVGQLPGKDVMKKLESIEFGGSITRNSMRSSSQIILQNMNSQGFRSNRLKLQKSAFGDKNTMKKRTHFGSMKAIKSFKLNTQTCLIG